jgi:hypothetical protein
LNDTLTDGEAPRIKVGSAGIDNPKAESAEHQGSKQPFDPTTPGEDEPRYARVLELSKSFGTWTHIYRESGTLPCDIVSVALWSQ